MKIVIDPGAYLPERAHDLDAGVSAQLAADRSTGK